MADQAPAEHAEGVATVQHEGAVHEAPNFLGLEAPWFIALAIIFVFAIMAWKKVPAAIGRALDSNIALIRDQLAEAESLRKEAEALRAEYETKAASADKDREALLERARLDADQIVAKAKAN